MVDNLKYIVYYFILPALLCYCMAGCSEGELDSSGNEEGKLYHIQITGLPTMPQSILPPSMHAYVFAQGVLQKAYNDITVGSDGVVEIKVLENSTVYFFSGVTASTGLDALVEGESQLSDFLNMNTPVLVENAEPALFYSGKTEENATNPAMSKHVSLMPGVARINLKIKNNADIKVTKIILDNVSQQTPLFASPERPVPLTTSRTIEFPDDGGIGDREGICHLYESGSSMTAIVHALYHGVVSIRKVTFPPIQRGFQYTLTLADIGTTTESAIVTEPFTDGGMVDATDDKRIYLYPNNTDGTISGNTLMITDGSNDEVMSFLAPFGVNLDIVEGNEYVSEVVKEGITKMEDMKLTTYRFRLSDVTPPGGSEKSIKVSVRSNEADPPLAQEFYLRILSGTPNLQPDNE